MAKGKVTLSAQEIADKWAKRTVAAIPDTQKGVDNVTVAPTQLAAAKQDKWLAGITAAAQTGKWKSKLEKVSLEDWKTKTKQKIGERMSGGVNASIGKRERFDQANIQVLNEILPKVANMPDLTLEDSIARATFFMRERSKKPYTG